MDSIETLTLENIDRATRDELRAFAKVEKLSGYSKLNAPELRELVRSELERATGLSPDTYTGDLIEPGVIQLSEHFSAALREVAPQLVFYFDNFTKSWDELARTLGLFEHQVHMARTRPDWNQVKRRQRRRSGRKARR